MNAVENFIERFVLSTRWLLVPLYVGMSASMVVFVIKFFQELFHLLENVMHSSESEWLLGILALIDNVLVANLVVMVLISGYETFVSPIHFRDQEERPGWLSKLDPGTVKVKLASSIVGISLIHLLATYLKINDQPTGHAEMQVVLHLSFVVTALLLAYIDILVDKKKGHAS